MRNDPDASETPIRMNGKSRSRGRKKAKENRNKKDDKKKKKPSPPNSGSASDDRESSTRSWIKEVKEQEKKKKKKKENDRWKHDDKLKDTKSRNNNGDEKESKANGSQDGSKLDPAIRLLQPCNPMDEDTFGGAGTRPCGQPCPQCEGVCPLAHSPMCKDHGCSRCGLAWMTFRSDHPDADDDDDESDRFAGSHSGHLDGLEG